MNIDKLPPRVRSLLEAGVMHVIIFGGLALDWLRDVEGETEQGNASE